MEEATGPLARKDKIEDFAEAFLKNGETLAERALLLAVG